MGLDWGAMLDRICAVRHLGPFGMIPLILLSLSNLMTDSPWCIWPHRRARDKGPVNWQMGPHPLRFPLPKEGLNQFCNSRLRVLREFAFATYCSLRDPVPAHLE